MANLSGLRWTLRPLVATVANRPTFIGGSASGFPGGSPPACIGLWILRLGRWSTFRFAPVVDSLGFPRRCLCGLRRGGALPVAPVVGFPLQPDLASSAKAADEYSVSAFRHTSGLASGVSLRLSPSIASTGLEGAELDDLRRRPALPSAPASSSRCPTGHQLSGQYVRSICGYKCKKRIHLWISPWLVQTRGFFTAPAAFAQKSARRTQPSAGSRPVILLTFTQKYREMHKENASAGGREHPLAAPRHPAQKKPGFTAAVEEAHL